MEPFNNFAVMAYSLALVALCTVAVTLRTFGFWRWLKYKYADVKAYLFDRPEDDCDVVRPTDWVSTADGWVELPPAASSRRPADAPKKRKRTRKS